MNWKTKFKPSRQTDDGIKWQREAERWLQAHHTTCLYIYKNFKNSEEHKELYDLALKSFKEDLLQEVEVVDEPVGTSEIQVG